MYCPKCKNIKSKVKESRFLERYPVVRRCCQCVSCGHKFTTYEVADVIFDQICESINWKVSEKAKPPKVLKPKSAVLVSKNARVLSHDEIVERLRKRRVGSKLLETSDFDEG